MASATPLPLHSAKALGHQRSKALQDSDRHPKWPESGRYGDRGQR